MAAGTSLICDTTILSDCSYRINYNWALFFGEISSISFSVSYCVRKLRGVETSRSLIQLSLTSLSKSKFSMI